MGVVAMAGGMGLLELFLSVLLAGISVINAATPVSAWLRTRDGRFLLLAGASGCLGILGALWAWSELPLGAPEYASVQLPSVLLADGVALLLLASTLARRPK
jgi:hypothetical protein